MEALPDCVEDCAIFKQDDGRLLRDSADAVGAGDVVKDALDEDDADVNAAGDVGEETR